MNRRPGLASWAGFVIAVGLLFMAPLVLPPFWARFATEILIWVAVGGRGRPETTGNEKRRPGAPPVLRHRIRGSYRRVFVGAGGIEPPTPTVSR